MSDVSELIPELYNELKRLADKYSIPTVRAHLSALPKIEGSPRKHIITNGPLGELELTVRTHRSVCPWNKEDSVRTIEDAIRFVEAGYPHCISLFGGVRNVGPVVFTELREALIKKGYLKE